MLDEFKTGTSDVDLNWNRLGAFITKYKLCGQQQTVGAETPRPVSAIAEGQLQTIPFETIRNQTQIWKHTMSLLQSLSKGEGILTYNL